jgi:hypothetical protein
MKNLLAGLLVMAVSTANAGGFLPASETLKAMAPTRNDVDVRERTAQTIATRAAQGYHYASVDMDGASWKEENKIKKELEAMGYDVDFGNDHHVYGWNNINGALVIRWVPRHTEPLFGGDR